MKFHHPSRSSRSTASDGDFDMSRASKPSRPDRLMELQGTRLSRFAAARLLHPTWAHNALLAADRLPAPMPPYGLRWCAIILGSCRNAGSTGWTATRFPGPGMRSEAGRSARRGVDTISQMVDWELRVRSAHTREDEPEARCPLHRREPLHIVLLDEGRPPVGAGYVSDAAGLTDAAVVDPHRTLAQL